MAGTAAGIAKARDAYIRKHRGRAAIMAEREQAEQESSAVLEPDFSDPAQPGNSVATVPTVGNSVPTASLNSQALGSLVLPSLALLGNVISGKVKAPVAVRVNAASKALDLAGFGRQGGHQEHDAPLAGTLDALARSLILRSRIAVTVDAVPATVGDDSVVAEQSAQSEQLPDK